MPTARQQHEVLSEKIRMKALELGYAKCGFAPIQDLDEYAAELLARPDYAARVGNPDNPNSLYNNCFPSRYYPEGKSIISVVVAFNDIDFPEKLTASVGRCYLARCYTPREGNLHHARFELFKEYIKSLGIGLYDGFVGPLKYPERMAGAMAGTVTYGDNNFARTEENGTFIILYTLLADTELSYDEPTVENPCPEGCTLCIDACPNHAILEPGRLDCFRCQLLWAQIPGLAPEELLDGFGTSIHGCDICQTVCPRNHKALSAPKRKDPFLEELAQRFDLEKILFLDEEYYDEVVYPIMYNYIARENLHFFRRNAAIALGNTGDASHIPALREAAAKDPDEFVRKAAEWALNKLSK